MPASMRCLLLFFSHRMCIYGHSLLYEKKKKSELAKQIEEKRNCHVQKKKMEQKPKMLTCRPPSISRIANVYPNFCGRQNTFSFLLWWSFFSSFFFRMSTFCLFFSNSSFFFFIFLFFCLIDSFTLSTQGKRNLLPVETALKQNNTKKSTIINTHLGLCYAAVVVGVAFLIHCCFLFFSLLSLLTTHLSIETQTKQTRDGCVLWYYTTPHRPPPPPSEACVSVGGGRLLTSLSWSIGYFLSHFYFSFFLLLCFLLKYRKNSFFFF